MIARKANIIGLAAMSGLLVAAAAVWVYLSMNRHVHTGSVEVQQLEERSWAVEVKAVEGQELAANTEPPR